MPSLFCRRRRPLFETLESRQLLAGDLSTSDATATEGGDALMFLDQFVQEGSGGLDRPRASTFGPDGNGDEVADLYVPSVDTDEVLRYDGLTGAFLDVFISASSGGLDGPGDLEFTPDGLLYVTSYVNNTLPHNNDGQLLRYDAETGTFLGVAASGLYSPLGVTTGTNGDLYIANETSNEVLRYDGTALSVFVTAGSGGLAAPRNAIIGPDGNLYVSSVNSGNVLRYDGHSGAFLGTFATTGLGSGPLWIEFGPDGLLYSTARTTTTSLDTTLQRFHGVSGALVDSFNIGGDHWSFQVAADGVVYLSGNGGGNKIDRLGPSSVAAFTVSLSSANALPVTVSYATANGSATSGDDFISASGTLTFAPGQTSRTILVQTVNDTDVEPSQTFTLELQGATGAVIADANGVGTIIDTDLPPTKFYVVDDATANRTFEYAANGTAVENYTVASGNSAPRGAASTADGDKVWVVDANRNVYVYGPDGTPLGSWSVGGFNNSAQFEGIATNGTDIWIVDNKSDKVYRFTGAASRLTGSQSAASSFTLNSGNKDASDLVTDGASIWVLNNTTTDKVFKYTVSGTLQSSWTITGGGGSPTGITIDPSNATQDMWIVDSTSDKVYRLPGARTTSAASVAATSPFSLSLTNTNPQGIADPPVSSVGGQTAPLAGSSADSAFDSALLAIVGELDGVLTTIKKRK